jgi:hypothetical protein
MQKNDSLADLFPRYLFWDVKNMSSLDLDEDKGLIIPRALFATSAETFENDIVKLEAFYPKSTILNILKETKELISNEVCRLVARRYHVKTFYRFDYARDI